MAEPVAQADVAAADPVGPSTRPACYNCGALLTGRFCAACGQKAAPLNPTLRHLVHDFTHEMLHVDGRIFRSVKALLVAPGFLTAEYFAGRKARWISPIRLYLVFSVIYFGLSALAGSTSALRIEATGTPQEQNEKLREYGFESEAELDKAVNEALTTWAPRVIFVLLPLFAWLVHILCRRAGRNYPQHLYFAFHVHAALFAVGSLASAAKLARAEVLAAVCSVAALAYGLWYIPAALRTAYDLPRRAAILRGVGLAIAYFIIVMIATVAVVLPAFLGRQ